MTQNTTHDLAEKLKTYRLSPSEYERITHLLGRAPEGVEWALFSALWSEHCSYKSSKVHLKKLFNTSPRVLQSFGENAGIVDLGEGEKVAFKMESHNHPSYIEPYQGAATGVGGILRDIFTMGARPIALADSLYFGESNAERMSSLVDGVVSGIGGYGNCVGVPTITGQTEFHSSYNKNILVNAMAVGLFGPNDPIFLSKAKQPGAALIYAGAKTGRDGVHGASMASEAFGKDSHSKRPTVQIGDPFYEKLLIEACLEVMKANLVLAIQDMGAAGLTSSSFEMAAKGDVGLDIFLHDVPLRDSSMSPEDILLSESQERMLMVVDPKNISAVQNVFHRWGLDATVIGEVKGPRVVRLFWKAELLCTIDPCLLTDSAPEYERPYLPWVSKTKRAPSKEKVPENPIESLNVALGSLAGCSREWIYQQYDQRVGAMTMRDCSSPVGVQRLPFSGRGLGIVTGCRPHIMRLDAEQGGRDAVAYPLLQLAAKGFEAVALTDCLNYGNPERVEVMSEFVASLEGLNEMCQASGVPIISGNVSFYNETEGRNITSTPSTGLVGVRPTLNDLPSDHFVRAGDHIFLMRLPLLMTGGVFQEMLSGVSHGCGDIDSKKVAAFAKCLRRHADGSSGFSLSATRVVGKFGLSYSLARMSMGAWNAPALGAHIFSNPILEWGAETLYEVIVTVSAVHAQDWEKLASSEVTAMGGQVIQIGSVGGTELVFEKSGAVSLAEIKERYTRSWRTHFENLA